MANNSGGLSHKEGRGKDSNARLEHTTSLEPIDGNDCGRQKNTGAWAADSSLLGIKVSEVEEFGGKIESKTRTADSKSN